MKKINKKGKHLCLEERVEIYQLLKSGHSVRSVGREIGRNHSVISRELRRNVKRFSTEYTPVKADDISRKRLLLQRQQAPLKNPKVFLYVREKLRKKRTPEQIAGRLSIDLPGEKISYETIYQYIYGIGRKDQLWIHLPRHHKKRKGEKISPNTWKEKAKTRGKISIEERHTKANNRSQIGHWETDLMESKRGIDTNVSADIERKTRYTKLTKLKNKKAKTKQKAMQKKLKMIQSVSKSRSPIVRTMTYDNGSENANHRKLNKTLEIKSYFCHPYNSGEKGSIENVIGRVRRFLPKGTDLSQMSEEYLQQVENWINDTPMKCLNWLTPNEAMEKEVNKYKFRKYRKVLNQSGAFPS
ncbi:IS30 family transposase [Patescibacteria group bacterium]|nr:IS30 family transposase [Patescibacteria group bacterium]